MKNTLLRFGIVSTLALQCAAQTPKISLTFDKLNFANSGSNGITSSVTNIDNAIVTKDSVLALNGSSALSLSNVLYIGAISMFFKSNLPINTTGQTQALFSSTSFNSYLGPFTSSITNEYIGWGLINEKTAAATGSQIDGKWHHVLFAYLDSTYQIYLDGVLLKQTANVPESLRDMAYTTTLSIGLQSTKAFGFKGYMDDVNIYGSKLTSTEIQSILSAQSAKRAKLDTKTLEAIPDQTPYLNFEFNNNSTNTGVGVVDVSAIGTPMVTKDSVLLMNGGSGLKIGNSNVINTFSALFKSEAPVSSTSKVQTLFNSTTFSGYFSNFTNLLTDEVVGFYFNNTNKASAALDPIADTLWHHLVVTSTGTAYELYIDGVKKSMTSNNAITTSPLNTTLINIGIQSTQENGFRGYLDNIRTYTSYMTQAEITALVEKEKLNVAKLNKKTMTKLPSANIMLAYYKFENNLLNEVGSTNLSKTDGNLKFKADGVKNTVVELDGTTNLYAALNIPSLNAFSCHFKPKAPITEYTSAKGLFSTYYGTTLTYLASGNVSSQAAIGEIFTLASITNTSITSIQYSTTPIAIDTSWHLLLLNYNALASNYDMYIDGKKQVSVNNSSKIAINGFNLGSIKDPTARTFFNGSIDEVKLYAVVQTPEYIESLTNEFTALHSISPTSIEDDFFSQKAIFVYPNPLQQDHFSIEGVDHPNYKVLDLTGNILVEGEGNKVQLPSSAKGIFILEVTEKDLKRTIKIIK